MIPVLILFDGECGICSWLVKSTFYLSQNSKKYLYYYCPLNSELGKIINNQNKLNIKNMNNSYETMYFIKEGRIYSGSTALIKSYAYTQSKLKILNLFLFIPKIIREFFYILLSLSRKKISKYLKIKTCELSLHKKLSEREITSSEEWNEVQRIIK